MKYKEVVVLQTPDRQENGQLIVNSLTEIVARDSDSTYYDTSANNPCMLDGVSLYTNRS